jgi:hypothetical protein
LIAAALRLLVIPEFQEEIICEEIPIPDIKLEVEVPTTSVVEPKRSPRQKNLKPKKPIGRPRLTIKKETTDEALKPKRLKSAAVDFVAAKFFCHKCDQETQNYAHLIKHRNNHASLDYKNRDCNLCGDQAVDDYEVHLTTAHPEYRPQQCLSCPANFVNHKDLKQHLLLGHQSKESLQCQACSATCHSQFSLGMHIASNCGRPREVKSHYNCHICGFPEATIQKTQEHIFENHPRDFRKRYFICFHCKRILMGAHGRQTVCNRCLPWQKKREKNMRDKKIGGFSEFHSCK